MANELLALAAYRGATQVDSVAVQLLRAEDCCADDIRDSDALILGGPENIGYASGLVMDLFNRCFYPCQGAPRLPVYALFLSVGNSGIAAIAQLEKILAAMPMKKIAEPLLVLGLPDSEALNAAEELGAAVANGIEMGIF